MDPRITTYEQAIEFLYGRINYERAQLGSYTTDDFKLDRMRHLLARLGNPQNTIPAIHIAGTKGKGTTALMSASILQAAGVRVGLFTSPHISAFEERIKVNGQMPSPAEIVELVQDLALETRRMDQLPGQMAPTFFELTMAMGWLWFRRQNAELAVLEVGLGGRLDATNICRPLACGITSISRDHTGLLGSRLEQIATEKAGIIKPGVPVMSGVEPVVAQRVIEEICQTRKAELWSLDREIEMELSSINRFSVRTPLNQYHQLQVPLTGSHQLRNAALAVGLMQPLIQAGWNMPKEAVTKGLANARCPLRIELIQTQPQVVLDVAHNWASVSALISTLNREFSANRRLLIFAASRDKDAAGMLRQLLPQFETVILTRFTGNPRGILVEKLAQLAASISPRSVHVVSTPSQAWQLAQRLADQDDLICGTGSFFIAAELREILLGTTTHSDSEIQKAANSVVDGLG